LKHAAKTHSVVPLQERGEQLNGRLGALGWVTSAQPPRPSRRGLHTRRAGCGGPASPSHLRMRRLLPENLTVRSEAAGAQTITKPDMEWRRLSLEGRGFRVTLSRSSRRPPFCAILALTICALLLPASSQSAEAPRGVSVELNKLESAGKNCRATLVIQNGGDTAYDELRLDLVIFDAESIVSKRLIVDVAPLAAKKTSVKTFDIADLACDGISRVLLNDVTACGSAPDCLSIVETSSRAATPFIK
jgi:hypothetical protein